MTSGFQSSWDSDSADLILGCSVLIGVDHMKGDVLVLREQVHGIIHTADETTGFVVQLKGTREGGTYRLPPDTTAFEPAPPGVYKLKTTGEEVENPDFLTSWTVQEAKQ